MASNFLLQKQNNFGVDFEACRRPFWCHLGWVFGPRIYIKNKLVSEGGSEFAFDRLGSSNLKKYCFAWGKSTFLKMTFYRRGALKHDDGPQNGTKIRKNIMKKRSQNFIQKYMKIGRQNGIRMTSKSRKRRCCFQAQGFQNWRKAFLVARSFPTGFQVRPGMKNKTVWHPDCSPGPPMGSKLR